MASASEKSRRAGGDDEVRKTLGLDAASGRRRRWTRLLIAVSLLIVVVALVAWRSTRPDDKGPEFATAAVTLGDLEITVTATGSVDALETVDVGAETSGRILSVLVDFNDPVTKGQVLAELDTEQLKARVDEASAQLRSARAQVRSAKATAVEAKQKAARSEDLAKSGLISQQALETARAAAERANAAVGTSAAQATVAGAALKAAQTSFDKATITSPIDGIVLSRNVEPGQTLASSFQVPVLFQIAKDLTKMELRVDVDEADIGRTKEGQPASFTVDAYPGKKFPSKVVSLRNVPKLEQNVVTYEAVLAVDNAAKLLRPGMTATATVITEKREGVLLVPNAALRFTPPSEVEKKGGGNIRIGGAKMKKPRSKDNKPPRQRVWVLRDGKPEAIEVDVGATDGEHTEISDGELEPGLELLVDLLSDGKD